MEVLLLKNLEQMLLYQMS